MNLALTLQRKNAPLPGAVLSMSPWFDMELKNESIDTNANVDKMLSRDLLRGFSDSMLDGTGIAITDPRINLAYADPAGLPPTMIYYGGYEVLVDDAVGVAGMQEGLLPVRVGQVDPDRLDAGRLDPGQRALDVGNKEVEVMRARAAGIQEAVEEGCIGAPGGG